MASEMEKMEKIEKCPVCSRELMAPLPISGEWGFYVTCKTMDCPYAMEYKDSIKPTYSYTRLSKKK